MNKCTKYQPTLPLKKAVLSRTPPGWNKMKWVNFSEKSNKGQLANGNNKKAAKRTPAGKYQLTVPDIISNWVLNSHTP